MTRARALWAETRGRLGRLIGARRPARPTTAGGFARLGARTVAVVAVLSVALFVVGTAAAAFYDQYGFHPEKNARAWAALEPAYADRGTCQTCHAAEYARQSTSQHEGIACESCHGPLRVHGSGAEAAAVPLATPPAGICATCHASTVGKPVGFPQVELASHFRSGVCRSCHDAHSTAVVRPPVVSHPLANLPGCTTCHNPDGLKKLPTGHEEAADAVCLGCHAAGADGLHGGER